MAARDARVAKHRGTQHHSASPLHRQALVRKAELAVADGNENKENRDIKDNKDNQGR